MAWPEAAGGTDPLQLEFQVGFSALTGVFRGHLLSPCETSSSPLRFHSKTDWEDKNPANTPLHGDPEVFQPFLGLLEHSTLGKH